MNYLGEIEFNTCNVYQMYPDLWNIEIGDTYKIKAQNGKEYEIKKTKESFYFEGKYYYYLFPKDLKIIKKFCTTKKTYLFGLLSIDKESSTSYEDCTDKFEFNPLLLKLMPKEKSIIAKNGSYYVDGFLLPDYKYNREWYEIQSSIFELERSFAYKFEKKEDNESGDGDKTFDHIPLTFK